MTGLDRLTALDAAFLHIEREGLPVHIGSVATFEAGPLLDRRGRLRIDELRAQVEARLDGLPRLRRKVRWPPSAGWAGPAGSTIPPSTSPTTSTPSTSVGGDLDALRRHAERLAAEVLPQDRPLWHLRFVTGLTGDRVGLVERVHHALVDGVSGVDVATVLLDLTPEVTDLPPSDWAPAPAPDARGPRLAGRPGPGRCAGPRGDRRRRRGAAPPRAAAARRHRRGGGSRHARRRRSHRPAVVPQPAGRPPAIAQLGLHRAPRGEGRRTGGGGDRQRRRPRRRRRGLAVLAPGAGRGRRGRRGAQGAGAGVAARRSASAGRSATAWGP